MEEQLKALAKAAEEFAKKNGLDSLSIAYDRRYLDEPWEITVGQKDGPVIGEGATATEAAQRLVEQLEAVS